MVNLRPDFYNMTFKLKPTAPIETGYVVEKLRPLAAYYHNGDLYIVCVNSADNGLVDVRMVWLMAD